MNKKTFLPLLLAAVSVLPGFGQSVGENEGQYRKDYVPVSPTTAALMRHVQCPVNYSTGRIDLSIPLYEIRTRDFTLPLSLKYAGGGVKVDDTDDIAGLGWTLDFGPTMGRSIQGLPDEQNYLLYNKDFGSYDPLYLEKLVNGAADEQADVFYYSTLSEEGSFLFKRPKSSAESGDRTPLMIPLTATKIDGSLFNTSGFTLKDGDGNTYEFTEKEYTDNSQLTGWKLKTLSSPHGDRLDFTYTTCDLSHYAYYDYYAAEDQPGDDLGRNGYWRGRDGELTFFSTNGYELRNDSLWGNFVDNQSQLYYDHRPGHTVKAKYPTEINYANGRVTFSYTGNLLTGMHVYEGGTEMQSVTFTYKKMRVGARSLLTGVAFTDRVTGKTRTYAMQYWHELDEYSPSTKAVDRHGYYNGHEENTDRVERRLVEFDMAATGTHSTYYGYIGGADRSPSADYAAYYSLQSIRYPDGASENFYYDLNRYTDDFGQEQYAGGLRIWQAELWEASGGLKNTRRFEYGDEVIVPDIQYGEETQKIYRSHATIDYFRYRLYPSEPVADAGSVSGTPILYRLVTERVMEGNGKETAVRRYEYQTGYSYPYVYGGMVHDNVRSIDKGRLGAVTDLYPETGDTLRHTFYSHKTLKYGSDGQEQCRDVRQVNILAPRDETVNMNEYRSFSTYNYPIRTDNEHPVVWQETVTDYYEGEPQTRTVTRSYGTTETDVCTGLPQIEANHYANGDSQERRYVYVHNVGSNSSVEALKTMFAANDLRKLTWTNKETNYGEVVQDGGAEFVYKVLPSNGMVVLGKRLSYARDENSRFEEEYTVHDAQGNACEIQRRDGSVTTILYGYHYTHPVCIVEGAAYNEVMAQLGTTYDALQSLSGSTLRNRLLGLRAALPAPCQVTVYDYAPTRGPVYRNAPDGEVTTWTYDGFGRLTETKDADGAVTEYNEYEDE